MMVRRLDADEQALWEHVTANVRPLHPKPLSAKLPDHPLPRPARNTAGPRKIPAIPPAKPPPPRPAHMETLDASWDRRIKGGRIVPDQVIDLHGHTLESARSLLYRRMSAAEADGVRILLVITGKGRDGAGSANGHGASRRGVIRAELPRWLGEAHLSSRIAAVRNAHPRHGGAGAVYIILKRRR